MKVTTFSHETVVSHDGESLGIRKDTDGEFEVSFGDFSRWYPTLEAAVADLQNNWAERLKERWSSKGWGDC